MGQKIRGMSVEAALALLARVHTCFTEDDFEVIMGAVPSDPHSRRHYVEAWWTVLDYLRRQGPDDGEFDREF